MGRYAYRRSTVGSRFRGGAWLLVFSHVLVAGLASAEQDLLELSLEELINVEVTSVSKKAESKYDTAASIHVITAEDIRRGAFTSVPEALRVVPGVQVSRIDASRWAISIRGYRQEFSNKLLVMIDGRTAYTPIFGGVIWAEQNVAMQDIARIEVIRGPGGSIWGANAVNGVINIITQHSSETRGGLAAIHGGTQEYGLMGRYGASIGEATTFRVTARGEKIEDYDFNQNYDGNDEWAQLRVGVRADTKLDDDSELTIHADYFDIDSTTGTGVAGGPPFFPIVGFSNDSTKSRGGDVMVKFKSSLGERSNVELKASYDVVSRRTVLDVLSQTVEMAGQHDIELTDGLSMIWGLDYRFWTTHNDAITPVVALSPNDDDFHLGSGFLQLEFDLFDDMLTLIAGTKLSVNSWSGFEYQPSGRFVIRPVEGHTVWGGVSRAVRTPTHIDNDLAATIGPVPVIGDDDFNSEELFSVEIGYRFFGLDRVTAEFSAFYNEYEDMSALVGPPPLGPFVFDNPSSSKVIGGEAELSVLPTDWWRLTAGYSILKFLREHGPASPLGGGSLNRTHPRHQVVVRSILDLPANFELDAAVYWVDGLGATVPTLRSNNVTQYVRLDLRLGWQPLEWLEISLAGQNLLDARHAEFNDILRNQSTQIPRSGYAMVTVDF